MLPVKRKYAAVRVNQSDYYLVPKSLLYELLESVEYIKSKLKDKPTTSINQNKSDE